MKRFIPYCIFFLVPLWGTTFACAHLDNWATVVPNECYGHSDIPHQPPFAYGAPDHPCIPTGVNRTQPFHLPTTFVREYNGSNCLRLSCCALSVSLMLGVTRVTFLSLHAEKEYSGYYLYSLRKLLI